MPKHCDGCGEETTTKVIIERDGTKRCLCDDCLEQITCPDCGAVEGTEEWGTVGDGFDGYCPSCADLREANGEVEIG